MEFTAVITMIIVLAIIWGGFIFAIRLALQKEKLKNMKK